MKHAGFTVPGLIMCAALALMFLPGCEAKTVGSLKVISVSSAGGTRAAFTYTTKEDEGWIISGPPEYVKITLNKIEVAGTFSGSQKAVVWEGVKRLTIDGNASIDTSDMVLNIPKGNITSVILHFDPTGKVKGSIAGAMRGGASVPGTSNVEILQVTAYTKASFPFDEASGTGGAGGRTGYASYASGPAEEMTFCFGATADETIIETALVSPVTVLAGDVVQLSILFDLSRMLRFDNGLRYYFESSRPGGTTLTETPSRFFCRSVFRYSMAAFFGEPGKIQGYETHFSQIDMSRYNPSGNYYMNGVPGWMTLIFDGQGNFLSGNLIGNDDNALTVAKGRVKSMTPKAGGKYDLSYELGSSVSSLSGFSKLSSVGEQSAAVAAFTSPHGSETMTGEANFILRLVK